MINIKLLFITAISGIIFAATFKTMLSPFIGFIFVILLILTVLNIYTEVIAE